MTLAQKMFISTVALLVSLLVISAASLLGLNGLSRDLDVALEEYGKLDAAYDVSVDVATVRALLHAGAVDDPSVLPKLQSATSKLNAMSKAYPESAPTVPEDDVKHPMTTMRAVASTVHAARSDPGLAEDRLEISARAADDLNLVLDHIRQVITKARYRIQMTQSQSNAERDRTMLIIVILSVVLVIGAVIISIGQYRGVMLPLGRMRAGVRELAAGQFQSLLDTTGDREFSELAKDFNRMASELEALYRELEDKVRIKSRELVRSERLASVGFLAAGVAHEINNPLGIISGYAELTMRGLEKAADAFEAALEEERKRIEAETGKPAPQTATLLPDLFKHLQIICDEAFRCKKITQKLLSLARSEPEARGPVRVNKVAMAVVETVRGLPKYRDQRVNLDLAISDENPLMVMGNQTQLNQVLLNLTINALEAVDPVTGQVTISSQKKGDQIQFIVQDNGKGMTKQTLEHIFEPFYTEKRTATDGQSGTGLGLSITHAIVEDHDGKIMGYSDGPGKGSRFVIQLPATAVTSDVKELLESEPTAEEINAVENAEEVEQSLDEAGDRGDEGAGPAASDDRAKEQTAGRTKDPAKGESASIAAKATSHETLDREKE